MLADESKRVINTSTLGATGDGEQSLDRRSRYGNAITESAPYGQSVH